MSQAEIFGSKALTPIVIVPQKKREEVGKGRELRIISISSNFKGIADPGTNEGCNCRWIG
jgi:hypothetical protein